jgi:hypothetical protein
MIDYFHLAFCHIPSSGFQASIISPWHRNGGRPSPPILWLGQPAPPRLLDQCRFQVQVALYPKAARNRGHDIVPQHPLCLAEMVHDEDVGMPANRRRIASQSAGSWERLLFAPGTWRKRAWSFASSSPSRQEDAPRTDNDPDETRREAIVCGGVPLTQRNPQGCQACHSSSRPMPASFPRSRPRETTMMTLLLLDLSNHCCMGRQRMVGTGGYQQQIGSCESMRIPQLACFREVSMACRRVVPSVDPLSLSPSTPPLLFCRRHRSGERWLGRLSSMQ